MNQPELFDSSIEARFRKFHSENPGIFRLFIAFAEQAQAAGLRRIGAKSLAERIRWETRVITRGDGFKLNNSYVSRYARKMAQERPDLAGLLEMRGLRS